MQELINAIEAVVPGISVALPPSEPNSGFEIEQSMATQIGELWSIHTQAQAAAAQSKEHLSQIRHQLGERLCEARTWSHVRAGEAGGRLSLPHKESRVRVQTDTFSGTRKRCIPIPIASMSQLIQPSLLSADCPLLYGRGPGG